MPKDRFYRERMRKRLAYWRYAAFPDIWKCPACGADSISVSYVGSLNVLVRCRGCGLRDLVKRVPAYEAIDYYNRFTDSYYHKLAVRLKGIYAEDKTASPLAREPEQTVRPTDLLEGGEFVFFIGKDYMVDGRLNGVAKVENVVIFVPGAKKGEVVKAKIKSFVDRAFGIAELVGKIS